MVILKLVRRRIRSSFGFLILTTLAIVFGVGFVAGSLILSDSLQKTFDNVFSEAAANVEAQVQPKPPEFGTEVRTISEELTAELEALPEVAKATPGVAYGTQSVNDFVAQDKEGNDVKPNGPPVLTFVWSEFGLVTVCRTASDLAWVLVGSIWHPKVDQLRSV